MKKLGIIGAGISGLVLGYYLKDEFDVVIFDKSRGVGGRMATRRSGDFIFDHGTPFFTAKTNTFNDFLHQFINKKVVQEWNPKFARIIDYNIKNIYNWADSRKHYVASPYMTSFAKELGEEMHITLSTEITQIICNKNKVDLISSSGAKESFDYVITAIPPHQAFDILPNNCEYKNELQYIEMLPCFSMMLGIKKPLNINFDAALVKGADISFISIMNSKPKRQSSHAISVLSTNIWAKNNFTLDKLEVINHMKSELEKTLNCKIIDIVHEDLHRWKYANIYKQLGNRSFFDPYNNIGSIGDWCIEGKVEGAFLSAIDIVDKLRNLSYKNT